MKYIISVWMTTPLVGVLPTADGWFDLFIFSREDDAVETQQMSEYLAGTPTKVRME